MDECYNFSHTTLIPNKYNVKDIETFRPIISYKF